MTGKRQALFDFVGGGTVQYHLSRLLGRDLFGLYFATMNLPNGMYAVDTPDIETAYGNIRSYSADSQLAKYYLFLEAVLIDDKESFSHIDAAGNEAFEAGTAEGHYPDIRLVQQAILEYAADFQACFPDAGGQAELKFVDEILGMLFSGRCRVSETVRAAFINDDVYDGVGKYRLWDEV